MRCIHRILLSLNVSIASLPISNVSALPAIAFFCDELQAFVDLMILCCRALLGATVAIDRSREILWKMQNSGVCNRFSC